MRIWAYKIQLQEFTKSRIKVRLILQPKIIGQSCTAFFVKLIITNFSELQNRTLIEPNAAQFNNV